jgi:hypothetical protein
MGVLAARLSKTGKIASVNALEGLPNVVAQIDIHVIRTILAPRIAWCGVVIRHSLTAVVVVLGPDCSRQVDDAGVGTLPPKEMHGHEHNQ